MVKRYKAKTKATDVPPHVSMGFNQTWILLNNVLPRRHQRNTAASMPKPPQGRARHRYSAGRHHPGLWREVLPARHELAGQNERSTPVVMQYVGEQHRRRLADQHQDAGTGAAAAKASSPYAMR